MHIAYSIERKRDEGRNCMELYMYETVFSQTINNYLVN